MFLTIGRGFSDGSMLHGYQRGLAVDKFVDWLRRYINLINGAILVGGIFAMIAYDAFFR
jgi:hypothetical protein